MKRDALVWLLGGLAMAGLGIVLIALITCS